MTLRNNDPYGVGGSSATFVQRRERNLTAFEIAWVTRLRGQSRPVSWSNIAAQINRCEYDIRACCDPEFRGVA